MKKSNAGRVGFFGGVLLGEAVSLAGKLPQGVFTQAEGIFGWGVELGWLS